MSVILDGIDMPKCCIDCPIYNNEFGQCNVIPNSRFYREDGSELYDPFKEKNMQCPLRQYDG